MSRQTFKKQITSEETIGKINPDNQKLMKLFLKDKGRKCSDETLKQYTSALNIFFCWNVLECNNAFYPEIKKIEISQFFDYILDELKVNGKRFSFFKSVLSGLSDCVIKYYDEDERCKTFRNFINSVIENVSKEPVREKTKLNDETIQQLLNYLTENYRYQEACIVALAAYSGCRISEIEQIRIDSCIEERLGASGVFYVTQVMRTKGKGKQGKLISRNVLHDAYKPYLDRWLQQRKEIMERSNKEEHNMLFINASGDPATQNVLRGYLPKWEKIIGCNLYYHSFRHAFASALLHKYKMTSEATRKILHWESIEMCRIYDDADQNELDDDELDNLIKMFK